MRVNDWPDSSEDIKGIAFERFLGKTFRGEIGQFFTPRSIVEFMVFRPFKPCLDLRRGIDVPSQYRKARSMETTARAGAAV